MEAGPKPSLGDKSGALLDVRLAVKITVKTLPDCRLKAAGVNGRTRVTDGLEAESGGTLKEANDGGGTSLGAGLEADNVGGTPLEIKNRNRNWGGVSFSPAQRQEQDTRKQEKGQCRPWPAWRWEQDRRRRCQPHLETEQQVAVSTRPGTGQEVAASTHQETGQEVEASD